MVGGSVVESLPPGPRSPWTYPVLLISKLSVLGCSTAAPRPPSTDYRALSTPYSCLLATVHSTHSLYAIGTYIRSHRVVV